MSRETYPWDDPVSRVGVQVYALTVLLLVNVTLLLLMVSGELPVAFASELADEPGAVAVESDQPSVVAAGVDEIAAPSAEPVAVRDVVDEPRRLAERHVEPVAGPAVLPVLPVPAEPVTVEPAVERRTAVQPVEQADAEQSADRLVDQPAEEEDPPVTLFGLPIK